MKLIPISEHPNSAKILYDLLAERPAEASISHKRMPTWEEHLLFVEIKKPAPLLPSIWHDGQYRDWCLIQGDYDSGSNAPTNPIVGAVYLTDRNEIGVSIFKGLRGVGWGSRAVRMMMEKHGKRRYVANIAPANEASRKMFEKLGFRTIQHTLALDAD